MVRLDRFIDIVCRAIPRFALYRPNNNQQRCVLQDPQTPLMIVAGPGAGKTTVLVLRALRLVYVDGIQPKSIVVTTFTRKAAAELRSRQIEWGLLILRYLENNPPAGADPTFVPWLRAIDVNQFVTGTLDSICEDVTTTFRDPGVPIPVLLESFVANAILLRKGLFPTGAWSAADV